MEYDEQATERRWGERFGSTKKRGKKGVEGEGRVEGVIDTRRETVSSSSESGI